MIFLSLPSTGTGKRTSMLTDHFRDPRTLNRIQSTAAAPGAGRTVTTSWLLETMDLLHIVLVAGYHWVAYLGGAGIAFRGYHRGRSTDSPDQVPQESSRAATSKRACGAGAISTKASVSRWCR